MQKRHSIHSPSRISASQSSPTSQSRPLIPSRPSFHHSASFGYSRLGLFSRRRLLLALGAFASLFILIHFLSWSGSPLGSLPGFAIRSASSRRTDAYQITARRQKLLQAASGPNSGLGAANFSQLAPFTFCPTFGENDELGQVYGSQALLKTRTHIGSCERIHRVIRRAMAGLPITIGILGGSISSCHGLDATAAHPLGNPIGPNCYPHRIFTWLNDVFPHPANELTNGALRRTGTAYYGFCSAMHLPDRVDLVIVEFDTEDPHESDTISTTDLLIRSLLLRPDQPAVILLGHFAPQFQNEHGFVGPEVWHSAVAHFYDVPHLTVKGLLYEEYLANPEKVAKSYFIDPVLANAKGHELLADTVIAFLESEICKVWDEAALEADLAGLSPPVLGDTAIISGLKANTGPSLLGGKGLRKGSEPGAEGDESSASLGLSKTAKAGYSKIPPYRIHDKPHTITSFREIKPSCASANDLINPLPQSVFINSGWSPVAPKPDAEDERHFWFSEIPGSLIKIPLKVGGGDIAVYYQKGPKKDGWGSLKCWVDDNVAGAVEIKGYWDQNFVKPVITQIDRGVGKGPHYVVCELQGNPEVDTAKFKIYGIFSS
ncbi:hypothetical protein O181_044472 [Austropuccinia psidii MF-1]|uniref:Capsular associated protein n=1 Tax=Austropuccinia psidii MF-1 TaxID=1389203 RepID=A0A9Q3DMI3_9BASI|nr:hypothetical protein [Austropuccinia psidii MF-1]